MLIISACLAGVKCRYDGGNNSNKEIMKLVEEGKGVLVCPEQLGGLTTPRAPSEIIVNQKGEKRVINNEGQDVTHAFIKGAHETLNIAKSLGAKVAILKARSPSCGKGKVYDGTFNGDLINGNGITTKLLIENGIKVFTEEDLDEVLNWIKEVQ